VNTTPAYLFRKVSDPSGAPTILYDEIDTVFGPKAKDNEEVRGMLNAGHRKGATAGRCVVRGQNVVTEELPAYCAVALAGLNDLPDTIMSRAVVVRMQRRRPDEKVEPWRERTCRAQGEAIGDLLRNWANAEAPLITWPDMPDGIEDRAADVWEPLLAVADLAGEDWPQRARVAAVAHVADSSDPARSLGLLLLGDLREVFDRSCVSKLPSEVILTELKQMPESPWATLRGGVGIDARWLSRHLGPYGVSSKNVRTPGGVQRGYDRIDFEDAWLRYLPPRAASEHSATSATPLQEPELWRT
jgi:hypothetical protein